MESVKKSQLDQAWHRGWQRGVASSVDVISEVRLRYIDSHVHSHHITQIIAGTLSAIITELQGIDGSISKLSK